MENISMKLVVGIATVGRPDILRETLIELSRQTRTPDCIIVCGTKEGDIDGIVASATLIKLISRAGLPLQRNAIIDAADDADVLLFFDDDFLASRTYLAEIADHMARNIQTVVVTGRVLADGIGGPGLSVAAGRALLAQDTPTAPDARPVFSGYGCNMALRMAPLRANTIRFDERLPLYGWQEDVDMSRRVAPFGDVVELGSAHGVHLGVKSGRGSGLRLGYSQVANPLYLVGKRRGYPLGRALAHIAKNIAMNAMRFTRPEPYVDRRGRLRGNILALRDMCTGKMAPENVLDL